MDNKKNLKYSSQKDMGLFDPEQRLKALSENSKAIEVDPNVPPRRYYRSGVEMIRQANVYMEEGNLERGYTLYMKFLTIFLEKIREHPKYNTVSSKEKAWNQQMLRDVLPKTEELKKQLLDQYRVELAKHLEDAKERDEIEKQRIKREEQQRLKEEEKRKKAEASKPKIAISAAAVTDDDKKPKKLFTPSPDVKSPPEDKKIPSVDRSTKPHLQDDKLNLRDLILPTELMNGFLRLAAPNTTNKIETCGVLAGKLERNKLLVTHLLIPQQTGSPDSCITYNEEDIFDYQDQYSLITLGWIHTHPTQTAFLSSVDLHTHCAYQLMMAEAIAIVCAPKYDEFFLISELGFSFSLQNMDWTILQIVEKVDFILIRLTYHFTQKQNTVNWSQW
ncbi:STAM-binding protein isoform X2 [Belonocnema kinseyi]|uniref:STAM-binding protein isoform X2 n=1 Tax=Belonocnema kinseyi TaxID=2817044 RepID=UPI00143E06A2|nr:STAM-binding protein isoform X2 [Belonocnema kinseyi]